LVKGVEFNQLVPPSKEGNLLSMRKGIIMLPSITILL
jgi:hypothetical protein